MSPIDGGRAGFADLHVHLLPGLDDGPSDMDESLDLLRDMWTHGIRHICATPHVGPRGIEWSKPQAEALIASISDRAWEEGMTPDLRLGAEIALYAEMVEDGQAGKLTTLGGSRYVLIESPDMTFPPRFAEFLFRFRSSGLVPVLAHPERTDEIVRDPSRLQPYVSAGAHVQLTAISLTGKSGRKVRKAARHFLQNGWVHAIATDGHFSPRRDLDLGAAAAQAGAWMKDEHAARHLVTKGPLRFMGGANPMP